MSQSYSFYKIRLLPLGRFFFGGEVVLGGEDAQEVRRRSYLVHSNIMPQQTSILGMLREQLLRENDLLYPWTDDKKKQKSDAIKLIGKEGFNLSFDGTGQAIKRGNGFGYIQELSPIFLEDEKHRIYQPLPLDDGIGKDEKPLSWKQDTPLPLLEHLDAKTGLKLYFASEQGDPLLLENVFQKQDQVGITVTNRRGWREDRANDKEAFFRQSFYRNKNSAYTPLVKGKKAPRSQFAFCCWVKIRDDLTAQFNPLRGGLVTLGGERSTFKMEIEKIQGQQKDLPELCFEVKYRTNKKPPVGFDRILLLNDTYLPTTVLDAFSVIPIAHSVSFRFFTTVLGETTEFYSLKRELDEGNKTNTNSKPKKVKWNKSGRKQSQLFTLLTRGGVLLAPNGQRDEVIKSINNQLGFHQIGYNYCQKI